MISPSNLAVSILVGEEILEEINTKLCKFPHLKTFFFKQQERTLRTNRTFISIDASTAYR